MIHHEEHRAHEGKDICDSILSWINLFALFEVFVVKNGLWLWLVALVRVRGAPAPCGMVFSGVGWVERRNSRRGFPTFFGPAGELLPV